MSNGTRILWSWLLLQALFAPPPADAGCGCEKPPPLPAAIRPAFSYPGSTVIVFGSALVTGETYEVVFESGTKNAMATVTATAVLRKDQADGVAKPQLRVEVPSLPLGPTEVTVEGSSGAVVSIPDSQFTMINAPIVIPENATVLDVNHYRAGVDRAGNAYVAFDLSNLSAATTFWGYAGRMRFKLQPENITFYNQQGFFFESLVNKTDISGVFDGAEEDSDALWYWRHEFQSYRDRHLPGGTSEPSADDPDFWHADGTPHIDHDHVIMVIPARLRDGSLLPAGRSKLFRMHIETIH